MSSWYPHVKDKWSHAGIYFQKYAARGDDVLIADAKVGSVYKSLLQRLGVAVSLAKSLISNSGCIEFAKKGLMAILHKSKDDFSTLCRIGGLSYRALGRIDYKRSLRRILQAVRKFFVPLLTDEYGFLTRPT
ncbi:RNA-dependent RNA polymerase, mitoviral [Cucumis melo var. makuwa]|uniref:RNA-dependent RNA polymerase, mitoviral n=1 Tax=Cucumis melo var. makuwa TaxID=1194695 RepID=A0A5D3CX16_CUCMM|nr:RNA-dependent RNA polymerase, mitoviral [Cucumis melo var. makuwa]TYK16015.1 RNA-dependent RNA polymerase, mitoviral [Cucumis melo var. makuwa]